MKRLHKYISVRPVRIEANLIGNHKSHLNFVVQTTKCFVNYGVDIDNGLLLELVDTLKRGIDFERVVPEGWVSFSDREPHKQGEYVMRYNCRTLCTFPTLESALGAYRHYGAIEWRLL